MMHTEFLSPSCFQMVHIKKQTNKNHTRTHKNQPKNTQTKIIHSWKFSHACTLELLSQQKEPNLNSLSSMIAHSTAADCRSVLSRCLTAAFCLGVFFPPRELWCVGNFSMLSILIVFRKLYKKKYFKILVVLKSFQKTVTWHLPKLSNMNVAKFWK